MTDIIAALEQIFGTDSLGDVAAIVGKGLVDVPARWRQDAKNIVAFIGATFDLVDQEYAAVVRAVKAGDADAAGRALVRIEGIRKDAQALAGAFANRAMDVAKKPWGYAFKDPFKGERELAKAMARRYAYPLAVLRMIGA